MKLIMYGAIGWHRKTLDPSVLPSKRWAVYSWYPTFHKLTGSFDGGIYSAYGYTALSDYLHQKHNLSPAKMDKVNVLALQSFLSSMKVHKQASIIKMIHNWIPTYSMLSRQGRKPSPLCPRCCTAIETSQHVYKCSQSQAISNWRSFLKKFLSSLLSIKTLIYNISTLEYKLSITLEIPFIPTFHIQDEIPPLTKMLLINAIRHQNIIGWDNFLRGYMSLYWLYIFQQSHTYDNKHPSQTWEKTLWRVPLPSCSKYGMIETSTYMAYQKLKQHTNYVKESYIRYVTCTHTLPNCTNIFQKLKQFRSAIKWKEALQICNGGCLGFTISSMFPDLFTPLKILTNCLYSVPINAWTFLFLNVISTLHEHYKYIMNCPSGWFRFLQHSMH